MKKEAKKNIHQSMIRLLDQYPYETLTITRICQETHISRQAFYLYYRSKDDLIKEVYINILESTFLSNSSDESYFQSDAFIDHVIDVYDKHSALFISLEKWYVSSYLSKEKKRIIEKIPAQDFKDPYINKYSHYYLVSILSPLHYIMLHWLYNNKKETK